MVSTKRVLPLEGERPRKKAAARQQAKPASNDGKRPARRTRSKLAARTRELASTMVETPEELALNEELEVRVETDELPEEPEMIELAPDTSEIPETIPEAERAQADEDLLEEDVLEAQRPEIAAELAEDPVRLYLREIGEVKLLDSDSEFRLATLIEAKRQLAVLGKRPAHKEATKTSGAYHNLVSELSTSWQRFIEDAKRLNKDLPDLCAMLEEAQALHEGW